MISEAKMKIVIDNYFKSECNVDTSIRQAFEKGFRIGVQKGITLQPERKKGKWIIEIINSYTERTYCSICKKPAPFIYVNDNKYNCSYGETELTNFCPNCGADMRGEQE